MSDQDRKENPPDRTDTGSDGLIPSVDIPAVDVPEPTVDAGDVDSEVVTLFWKLVLVFNVALFGVAVGPMVLYVRGDRLLGGGLLAVGLLAGTYGFVRYGKFRNERREEEETETSTGPDDR